MGIKQCFFTLCSFFIIGVVNAANARISTDQVSSQQQVIKLKATIVGSKEQPRFLSIVPWKKLASPVTYSPKVSSVMSNQFGFTSPTQLQKQQKLAQYLKARYVKKLASNK
jgi:hypothetical protein